MSIGWIMGGFFVFVTLVFVVLAVFLPEWVGITGKKAREIMKEQEGENHADFKAAANASSASADSKTSTPQ